MLAITGTPATGFATPEQSEQSEQFLSVPNAFRAASSLPYLSTEYRLPLLSVIQFTAISHVQLADRNDRRKLTWPDSNRRDLLSS